MVNFKSIFRVSTKEGNVGLFITGGDPIGVYSLHPSHTKAFNNMPSIADDYGLEISYTLVNKSRGTDKEWLCAFNSKDDFFNYIADDEALAKLEEQGYVISEYLVPNTFEYLRQSKYQSFFRKDVAVFKASFRVTNPNEQLFVNRLAA